MNAHGDGSRRLEVEAPAKLNLSLRVLGKRDDGFHEIDTVMVRLGGLSDALSFEESDEDGFECDRAGVPADSENLVVRARELFRERTGRSEPLRIRLDKRVPHGAGLGGGSSDAAAALRGLNEWFETGLEMEELCELGARLGSDVPFFLGPAVARVRGRGEILEAGPELPPLEVVLLKPEFGVATPEAYARWKSARELPGVDYGPQEGPWGALVNDLERPVFEKHLFLAEVKNWLRAQGEVEGALMSGSGSTMFAILKGKGGERAAGLRAAGLVARAREELDPGLWVWSGMVGVGG